MKQKSLFIVWAAHSRRAETLAAQMGGSVSFQFAANLKKKKWLVPVRYVVQAWNSWRTLEREQPDVVLVQSPPIFASLLVALWCKLRKRTYAIDAHSGAFYYGRWKWALPVQAWLSRRAVVTIVAHDEALKLVQSWGAKGVFLEDKIPLMPPSSSDLGSEGQKRVAIISSFDYDEPETELFAAARQLPHVTFYHTGNYKKASPELLAQKPDNLILTGFVSNEDYNGLVRNVDGLVILTTEPNLLNCGAYEALAVERPAVISDWPGLRRYFSRGFVYVSNTPGDIAAGIEQMLSEKSALVSHGQTLRVELADDWQRKFDNVTALLEGQQEREPVAV